MIIILKILYKEKIIFSNFSLENMFIKKLDIGIGQNFGLYKYVINGVSYYMPNYGNLVMLDSKFQDIDTNNTLINNASSFKIIGKIFEDIDYTEQNFNNKFKDIITKFLNLSNQFSTLFHIYGGFRLEEDLKILFENINKSSSTMNSTNIDNILSKILFDNFKKYMNNRIGTELRMQENNYLNHQNKNFNIGDLVAYKIMDKYYIASICDVSNDNKKYKILTCNINILLDDNNNNRDNLCDEIVEISINNNEDIIKIYGNIQQDYRVNLKLSEESILETYYI